MEPLLRFARLWMTGECGETLYAGQEKQPASGKRRMRRKNREAYKIYFVKQIDKLKARAIIEAAVQSRFPHAGERFAREEYKMQLRLFQKGFNFSQDGPGNRLVYHLQGCNLHCPWCSNPEGMPLEGGWSASAEELAAEAVRCRPMFFEGGGVTLTGGEVGLQLDRVKQLLIQLKKEQINTCIETNGTSPRLPELFPFLDYLIMDLKHYDAKKHRQVIGEGLENVEDNIRKAIEAGLKPALRIPLIGGFNASIADAEGFAALLTGMGVADKLSLELLKYHEYGRSKYDKLHIPYKMGPEARVSDELCRQMEDILRRAGLQIIHT